MLARSGEPNPISTDESVQIRTDISVEMGILPIAQR
jgi:hypothetical protein